MVDVESLILSAILSGVVSLLVAIRYGPRAVHKENVKRLHSEKLVKETLATWEHELSKYCHFGVGFKGLGWGDFSPSPKEGGGVILGREGDMPLGYPEMDMKARDPIDPPLDYLEELYSHLVKGYPETAQQWQELKRVCSQLNEKIKGFLDEISKEVFFNPSERPLERFWHWDGLSDPPPLTFILLEDITFLVWLRLEERVTGRSKLKHKTLEITGPKDVKGTHEGTGRTFNDKVYELDWKNIGHPTLVRALEEHTCQAIKAKIDHISDSSINLTKVKDLIHEMDEAEKLAGRFQRNLQEIRTEIDLGKNLKGNCKVCQRSGIMG